MADVIAYHEEIMRILESNKSLKPTNFSVGQPRACAARPILGLSAGSKGALVGAAAGGIVGYFCAKNYASMLEVLKNMPHEDKERLVHQVQKLVKDTAISALLYFLRRPDNSDKFANLIQNFEKEG